MGDRRKNGEVIKDGKEIEELIQNTGFTHNNIRYWGYEEPQFDPNPVVAACEHNFAFFMEMFDRLCGEREMRSHPTLRQLNKTWQTVLYSAYYWGTRLNKEVEDLTGEKDVYSETIWRLFKYIDAMIPCDDTDHINESLDWELLEEINGGTYR